MRWEYKAINFCNRSFFTGTINADMLEKQLNDLGRENWEVVSVSQSQMQKLLIVLKRPK